MLQLLNSLKKEKKNEQLLKKKNIFLCIVGVILCFFSRGLDILDVLQCPVNMTCVKGNFNWPNSVALSQLVSKYFFGHQPW